MVAEESPDLAGPLARPERARGPFPPFCVSATLMHFHSEAFYPPSTPICTHTHTHRYLHAHMRTRAALAPSAQRRSPDCPDPPVLPVTPSLPPQLSHLLPQTSVLPTSSWWCFKDKNTLKRHGLSCWPSRALSFLLR